MKVGSYIAEIFSSIQGEGGNVRGSYFGKRQIFVRFSGCNIAQNVFGTTGCFYCDSIKAQTFNPDTFRQETQPSTRKFILNSNPVNVHEIMEGIKTLITEDLHSISFTGGEPLCQLNFILNLAQGLKKSKINYPLYLETNGSIILDNPQLAKIGEFFKYCCCDIKDRSSGAASDDKWHFLVENELNFIKNLLSEGVEVFAKIVITSKTRTRDIEWIAQELSKIKYPNGTSVGLAIQPVFLEDKSQKEKYSVSNQQLNEIFYTAAKYLRPESLTLSIQAHKYLNIL